MLQHCITRVRCRKVQSATPRRKNLARPFASPGDPSPIRPTRPCRQGRYSVLAFETAAFFGRASFFFPFLSHYGVGSARELRKSGRNGSLVFLSFSSSRDVQSQSPQAQGSEPSSPAHS